MLCRADAQQFLPLPSEIDAGIEINSVLVQAPVSLDNNRKKFACSFTGCPADCFLEVSAVSGQVRVIFTSICLFPRMLPGDWPLPSALCPLPPTPAPPPPTDTT